MSNKVINQSYGLSVHTPIDRVVMLIARRLELDDGYDYKLERWIRLLKDNWIQTAGALARKFSTSIISLCCFITTSFCDLFHTLFRIQ